MKQRLALLADEMGLGKTPQAIVAAQFIGAKKIHVICPAVAKYNWQNEFKKFANIDAWVAESGELHQDKDVVISSYNYATEHSETYKRVQRDLLIVDEAHMLKESKSARTQKILGDYGLIRTANRFWALSGTPCPNHAGEMWALLTCFGITKMSRDGFIARYCKCHTEGRYGRLQITGTNTQHQVELKAMFKKASLRRLKKDVLDLPRIQHHPYYIKGDSKANILTKFPKLKNKLTEEFQILQNKLNFHMQSSDDKLIETLQLMSQSISSLRRYHGLMKVKDTAELIISELKSQEYNKVIVFGIHTDVLEYLQQSIESENIKTVSITGKTPSKQRQKNVELFQKDSSIQVFQGNIQAAGTAITLTAANQVIFIEDDWVPGNNAQAADRAHRIGQVNNVTVRHMAIRNSLDAKITATLVRKIAELSSFID